jgi:hypothetical protein
MAQRLAGSAGQHVEAEHLRGLKVDRQLGCYLQTMGTLSSADFITIIAESDFR